jgi:hypothetical protein
VRTLAMHIAPDNTHHVALVMHTRAIAIAAALEGCPCSSLFVAVRRASVLVVPEKPSVL